MIETAADINNHIDAQSNVEDELKKDIIDKLYDHYKETDEIRRNAQTKRDKCFVWTCVLEAASFLLVLKPQYVVEAVSAGVNKELGTDVTLGLGILQTLLWILTIYSMVQYVQAALHIERTYVYQKKIEKNLTEYGAPISREGVSYGENYPMVLNFIDLFYKMFCPILFFTLNIVHIVWEWNREVVTSGRLVCDTILCVSLEIITWFYFFQIHSKITNTLKKIPPIGLLAEILRKILKEV